MTLNYPILNKSITDTSMDYDTIDTDFWSEIQDCEGEIYDLDIPELKETQDFDFDSYLTSNIDY